MIVLVIREMDRAAAKLHPVSQGRFVNAMPIEALPAEGGDQRRMNVQDAAQEIVRDVDELKEASQADQLHAGTTAEIEKASAEFFARSKVPCLDHRRRHTHLLGTRQPVRVHTVGDNQHDLRLQATIGETVEQVLER